MTHHSEAWGHVKKHLFGKVCEVARRTPWGFVKDDPRIINVTVTEFLNSADRYDTILLHILSGECEHTERVKKTITSAFDRCIKLVILEHNPDEFDGLVDLGFIEEMLIGDIIYEDWGRNVLYACTTFKYLQLPQLSDKYYKTHIDSTYIGPGDHGIDTNLLVYTHTSESPIDFELPEGLIYWVIGGGIAYESMSVKNNNILMDSILRQVLLCAHYYEPSWKIDRLFDFSDLEVREWKNWRVIDFNGVKPDKILHLSLDKLVCSECSVYVSTVHINAWRHLLNNTILDGWTNRDTIQLR